MDLDPPPGATILADSSALVYLIEGEAGSARRRAVESLLAQARVRGWVLAASILVWTELLEKPLARRDPGLASRYRTFLSDSSRIQLRVVDVAVAEAAAALSASLRPQLRHRLSPADLIHIATARVLGAAAMLGNDEAWREVPGCPALLLVDELVFELGQGEDSRETDPDAAQGDHPWTAR